MTIDHAQPRQIPRLTRLWQAAFGDTEEAVAHFFRTGFVPENSAVADGGAGALYWFDCLWEGKRIAYIYAVATETEHRGKGICKKLMDWTADWPADCPAVQFGYCGRCARFFRRLRSLFHRRRLPGGTGFPACPGRS